MAVKYTDKKSDKSFDYVALHANILIAPHSLNTVCDNTGPGDLDIILHSNTIVRLADDRSTMRLPKNTVNDKKY